MNCGKSAVSLRRIKLFLPNLTLPMASFGCQFWRKNDGWKIRLCDIQKEAPNPLKTHFFKRVACFFWIVISFAFVMRTGFFTSNRPFVLQFLLSDVQMRFSEKLLKSALLFEKSSEKFSTSREFCIDFEKFLRSFLKIWKIFSVWYVFPTFSTWFFTSVGTRKIQKYASFEGVFLLFRR